MNFKVRVQLLFFLFIVTSNNLFGQITPYITATKDSINCGESSILTQVGCTGTFTWENGDISSSLTVNPKLSTKYSGNCDISPTIKFSLSKIIGVNSPQIPSIKITANSVDIYEGTPISFSTNSLNQGSSPLFEWKLNGKTVGTNSPTFTTSGFKNEDKIACLMYSSAQCRTSDLVASNFLTIKVIPTFINPSLDGGTCVGSELLIKSNPTSKILWKKNGLEYSNPKIGATMTGEIALKFPGSLELGQIYPFQIELDDNGNIYILESRENRILKIQQGQSIATIVAGGNGEGSLPNQLNFPTKFIIKNNILYIADQNNFRIQKWLPGASEGITIAGGNGAGSALNQFRPWGLIVDNNENIILIDRDNARILKWIKNANEGILLAGGNGKGLEPNQMYLPQDLQIDSKGNLYYIDRISNSSETGMFIKKWNISTNTSETIVGLNGIGSGLNQISTFLNSFRLLSDDYILIPDTNNSRILKWSIKENQGVILAGGYGQGTELNKITPFDAIFDKKGDLLVADVGTYPRIIKFENSSTFGSILFGGQSGYKRSANQLNTNSIAIDLNANLYIYSNVDNSIKFYPKGSNIGTTVAGGNGYGSGLNQLSSARKIIYKDGYLYIVDGDNHRIMKWLPYASTGVIVAGGNGAGMASNQLNNPFDLFIDKNNNYIISDSNNHRIVKWISGTNSGITIAGGNGAGVAMNQLNFPRSAIIDNSDNLFIADQLNYRVIKWPLGANLGSIYLDRGRLPSQVIFPTYLFLGKNNILYINDLNRILKSNLNTSITNLYAGNESLNSNLNNLIRVTAINFDSEENFYLAQNDYNRILKFTPQNNTKLKADSAGVYTATVQNSFGNYQTNSITVTNVSTGDFKVIQPNKIIWPGKSVVLNTTGCTGNVSWSNNLTDSSITVVPLTTTEFTAICQQSSCQVTKSVNVEITSPEKQLSLTGTPDTQTRFFASKVSSTQKIPTTRVNSYLGLNAIQLTPGFIADKGSTFEVNIQNGCDF
jgi:hypothetical protein